MMKKSIRITAICICLSIFSMMAIASGSSSTKETKRIVETDENGETHVETIVVEETEAAGANVSIEEQELVNQDGIVITATEYVTDSIWGDGIKLHIENTSDRNVTVGCSALIVNNYMITDLFAESVAAGMRANENLYLSSRELEAAGIDTVGKIEVYFHVYDSDTYDRIFDSECVTIETSAINDMDITVNDDGFELYNENGIRIIGKTVDENSFWGTAILLYIENNTEDNISVYVDNMAINGYMVNPVFASTIYSQRMAIDDITIFSSDLEENGITSIDEVSLSFRITNDDTYRTIVETDAITFSAS